VRARWASWEMKARPTPPAPVRVLEEMCEFDEISR